VKIDSPRKTLIMVIGLYKLWKVFKSQSVLPVELHSCLKITIHFAQHVLKTLMLIIMETNMDVAAVVTNYFFLTYLIFGLFQVSKFFNYLFFSFTLYNRIVSVDFVDFVLPIYKLPNPKLHPSLRY
jgi:hypothetical protein